MKCVCVCVQQRRHELYPTSHQPLVVHFSPVVPALCIVSALVLVALFPLWVFFFLCRRLPFPEEVLIVCFMFPFGKPICVRVSGGVSASSWRAISVPWRKKKMDKGRDASEKQRNCLKLTKVSLKASDADNVSFHWNFTFCLECLKAFLIGKKSIFLFSFSASFWQKIT